MVFLAYNICLPIFVLYVPYCFSMFPRYDGPVLGRVIFNYVHSNLKTNLSSLGFTWSLKEPGENVGEVGWVGQNTLVRWVGWDKTLVRWGGWDKTLRWSGVHHFGEVGWVHGTKRFGEVGWMGWVGHNCGAVGQNTLVMWGGWDKTLRAARRTQID